MSISNKRSQNCSCRGTRTWKSTTSVLRTLVGDLIYDCVGNLVLATSNPFTMDLQTLFNPQAPIVNEKTSTFARQRESSHRVRPGFAGAQRQVSAVFRAFPFLRFLISGKAMCAWTILSANAHPALS